ncbi:unnamed protein product [Linum tenue]|uniref:AT-hook motif nuclear-localized protein n=2 Tax=Linum tenue TaxID=586396 RepID=A0AAV0JWU6_9ROSI|nr:unnamed protein product [Linum tenue]
MEAREVVVSSGGGVTVVGSDAPSDYQISHRSDHSNSAAPPGSAQFPPPQAVVGAPPPMSAGMPVKKKRGRPRKYAPDGSVPMALSPKPISSAAPAPPPVIDFSSEKRPKVKSVTKKYEPPPPPQQPQAQAENFEYAPAVNNDWVACSAGANFTPHIITVNAGEDVTMKIISFSQQGPRAICILSANGVISSVTLRQPDSSGGTLTFEGRFEILSLSGSFMPTDTTGGTRSRSGGMSVSLASPDGRVLGGGVAGLLVAAGPVQVVVGSFLAGNQHEQKPKKPKPDSFTITTTTTTTNAIPISVADPKSGITSTSFRGDTWSSIPADSRSEQGKINMTVHAGMHMEFLLLKPISVILILCLLAAVLLSTLSSPVFLLSLFNSMVLAIAVGSCSSRNSYEEHVDGGGGGGIWSSFQLSSYRGAGDDYSCYAAVRNDDEDDMSCDGKDEDDSDSESKDGCKEEDDEVLEHGYDEDDDDDGSDGEVGWLDEGDCEEEEEEVAVVDDDKYHRLYEVDGGEVLDYNLEKRAEEFITKVTKGWRDELLRDHQTEQWEMV